jgi:hypothetical protein
MRPFEFCVLGLSELALFGAQTLRCPQVLRRWCAATGVTEEELSRKFETQIAPPLFQRIKVGLRRRAEAALYPKENTEEK